MSTTAETLCFKYIWVFWIFPNVYISVLPTSTSVPGICGGQRGVKSLGTGVVDGHESSWGHWEENLGPLQNNQCS